MASCFVAVETETKKLAGYYTLAAASVGTADLPDNVFRHLPRYPLLLAALIGRLAVDQEFRRRGLGGALLADAALRVLNGDVKAFALVVEAKDENAISFYKRQGFVPFASQPRSLFLPLGSARRAAGPSLDK